MKEDDSMIVDNPREVVAESRYNSTYIVDLMAALRSMVQIPESYEELSWNIFKLFSEMVKIKTGSLICFVTQYPAPRKGRLPPSKHK